MGLDKTILKVLSMPCDSADFEEMLHYMKDVIDSLYSKNEITKAEHCTVDAWIDAKLNNL